MITAGLLTRAAARLRPRLTTTALHTAVTAASTLHGSGPVLVLPPLRRVVVLAPHPDDETIGCGGTIARLAAAGTRVTVVAVTDGEATIGSPHGPRRTAEQRRHELALACTQLGVGPPVTLGLPDGGLPRASAPLVAAVRRILDAEAPDAVFAPWPLEAHADHRAVTRALVTAAAVDTTVYGYEAHTPIPAPTHVFDITPTLARKRAALRAHATAGLAFDLEACLGLARWRSLATGAGRGAAEAFLCARAADLRPVMDAADAAHTAVHAPGRVAGTAPDVPGPAARRGRRLTHSDLASERLPLPSPRRSARG